MSYAKFLRNNIEAGRTVILAGNILGISPFNPMISDKYKLMPIIYSGALMVWYSAQIILSFYIIRERTISAPVIAIFLQKICENLVPIMAIFGAFIDKEQTPREAVDGLAFCDICLHTIGVEFDISRAKKVIERYSLCASAYIVFLFLTALITLINFKLTSFLTMASALVNLSHVFYTIYFSFFVCTLPYSYSWRFQRLNDEIKAMVFADLHTGVKVIKVKPLNKEYLKVINTIKFVHAVYRELVFQSSQRFKILITLQLFQCLTVVTLLTYILLCAILSGQIFEKDALFTTAILLIMLAHNLLIILIPITYCLTTTSTEANKMESIIHELMNETEDQELLRELEIFSLELIHGRVEFTACDFFIIDYTLFTKIAGAVVSNVIIFMQFGTTDYKEFFYALTNGTNPS